MPRNNQNPIYVQPQQTQQQQLQQQQQQVPLQAQIQAQVHAQVHANENNPYLATTQIMTHQDINNNYTTPDNPMDPMKQTNFTAYP
jgi:hypothetical protein